MECSLGTLKVFVKSRKVPVALTEFSKPAVSVPWLIPQPATKVTTVVFANVLDDAQKKLVEDARLLSSKSGLDLEVVDLAKGSLLRRLFAGLLYGTGALSHPELHLWVRNPPVSRGAEFEHQLKTN